MALKSGAIKGTITGTMLIKKDKKIWLNLVIWGKFYWVRQITITTTKHLQNTR
jgi:hypothetical protein